MKHLARELQLNPLSKLWFGGVRDLDLPTYETRGKGVHCEHRGSTSIGLLVGCLAGLTGVAAGAEKADSTATVRDGEVTGLERRLASLRREGRMLRRAATLLSEVALFDEEAGRGRSVSVEFFIKDVGPPNNDPEKVPLIQRQFSVGDEATGIGGGRGGLPVSGTDMERVEAEIRTLEMRLKALKEGAQKR